MTNKQIIERMQQISMELVDKYYESERTVIYDFSGSIKEDIEKLDSEVQQYKDELVMLPSDVNNNEKTTEAGLHIKYPWEDVVKREG